jgi:hypothetical protein
MSTGHPVLARSLLYVRVDARKEDKTMAEKILVALKRHDRVEEVVPYIERVTQPGASVVFLIHHPVNSLKWLQAYCGIMECGLEKTIAMRRMVESYSMKMRRQLGNTRCLIPVKLCTAWG